MRTLILLAVCCFGLAPVAHAQDDAPLPGWEAFAARFVTPDGRVVDSGNGGISHSEGQGYGMILAEAAADRPRFERIWAWTQSTLQTRPEDGLFAWRWSPEAQAVTDENTATDGDLLIAWGLLRAAARWPEPEGAAWRAEALAILDDVARLAVVEAAGRPVLLPGLTGFRQGDGVVVNPSYWVFPALTAFAAEQPEGPWQVLHASGLALLREARFGAWRLPADWVALPGPRLAPEQAPVFGFNAVRVPLHLVWDGVTESGLLHPFRDFWSRFDGQPRLPATVDLTDGRQAPYGSDGVRAVSVLTRFHGRPRRQVETMLPPPAADRDYYNSALVLLTRIALREGVRS